MKSVVIVLNNELYLEKLIKFKDNFAVKVITGMRGVGKTTLLSMFADTLKNSGVPSEEIIYINFEENEEITDFQKLYEFVNEKIAYLEQAYLLLDEIQHVKGWEKAINAFFVGSPVDIYVTGSNSAILSDTFLNLLSDHYEHIQMYPLSFNEYLKAIHNKDREQDFYFHQYLKYGGLPIVTKLQGQTDIIPTLLLGMYHTILNKDIISLYGVRDASLLDSMNKFLAINIGNRITPKVLKTYLENFEQITTIYTMDNYLQMINDAGLFYRISRYDIKAQTTLNGSERIYCADLGIRNLLLNFVDVENAIIPENIVCIELLRRGYKVFIGKIGKSNINFVAFKNDKPIYVQVVSKIDSKAELRKALYPLQRINDQYDKMIISMERPEIIDYNGIKVFYIFDFINEDI